jgi:hypothetical protein
MTLVTGPSGEIVMTGLLIVSLWGVPLAGSVLLKRGGIYEFVNLVNPGCWPINNEPCCNVKYVKLIYLIKIQLTTFDLEYLVLVTKNLRYVLP